MTRALIVGGSGSLTLDVDSFQKLVLAVAGAESTFGDIVTTIGGASIPSSDWPEIAPSTSRKYATALTEMSDAGQAIGDMFAEATDLLYTNLANYQAAEGATVMTAEDLQRAIQKQGEPAALAPFLKPGSKPADAAGDVWTDFPTGKITGLGLGLISVGAATVGAAAWIEIVAHFLEVSVTTGMPLGIGYAVGAFEAAVIWANLRSWDPFSAAQARWKAAAQTALVLADGDAGTKGIASYLPVAGWKGAAESKFTPFMQGTGLQAIRDFAKLASDMADVCGEMVRQLEIFAYMITTIVCALIAAELAILTMKLATLLTAEVAADAAAIAAFVAYTTEIIPVLVELADGLGPVEDIMDQQVTPDSAALRTKCAGIATALGQRSARTTLPSGAPGNLSGPGLP